MRRIYGVLEKRSSGATSPRPRGAPARPRDNLLQVLETRLDNVVYRLGLGLSGRRPGSSSATATSLLNGRKTNIPSFGVRPNDVVTMKAGSPAEPTIRDATDLTASVAPWLQADHEGLTGKVLKWPERTEIDAPVQESLIVELYSK